MILESENGASTPTPAGLLTIDRSSREEISALLDQASDLQRSQRPLFPRPLEGKIVGLFFFQTSTRTRVGFHAAAARLGATAIEVGTGRYEAGMLAPETAADTFRSIASYCDLAVIRHRDEEQFHQMVRSAEIPVINGGCGTSSHPTQTLIDLFAIRTHHERLDHLRVGIAGDLAGSRSARSLIRGLFQFSPAEIRLMAPADRQWQGSRDRSRDISIRRLDSWDSSGLDVLYLAGFPVGENPDPTILASQERFRLTHDRAQRLDRNCIVLCPLPRIDEIEQQVDALPQAMYFEQSRLGLFVRMAILLECFAHPSEST